MIPTNYSEVDALYRQIVASGAKRLAVTAAGSGEGVTTTAYALARRATQAGRKVLLIDLNPYRSAFGEILGLGRPDWAPGDLASVDTAISELGSGTLSALPSPDPERVGQSFKEPEIIVQMLDHLALRFDLIVVDLAPVRVRNARNIPPLAVCRAVGSVMFCVMARATSQSDAQEAITAIEDEGATLLGAVINDRNNPSLGEEMERESRRLERVFPRLAAWLQARLRRFALLYQLP